MPDPGSEARTGFDPASTNVRLDSDWGCAVRLEKRHYAPGFRQDNNRGIFNRRINIILG